MLNMLESTTLANAMWLLKAARNNIERNQGELYNKFLEMINQENTIISREDLSGEFIELLSQFQQNERLIRKHDTVINAINHHLNCLCEQVVEDMMKKGEAEI